MKNKVFIYLYTIVFSILFSATVYIVVNPKLENTIFINDIPIKESSSLTAKYLLKKLDENRKYTLIFGTSRSSKISSELYKENILNFSESLYGFPSDILNLLKQLNKKQLSNINKIYYLVDNHTFRDKESSHINYLDSFIYKQLLRLDINAVFLSFQALFEYNLKKGINKDGSYFNKDEPQSKLYTFNRYHYEKEFNGMQEFNFKRLKLIKSFAHQNNIDIVFFTSTMSAIYLQNIIKDDFLKHRKMLIENLDEIYDFGYIKSVSDTHKSFTDATHLTTEKTKYMIEHYYKNLPSTYSVNKNNFNEFYNNLYIRVNTFKRKLF